MKSSLIIVFAFLAHFCIGQDTSMLSKIKLKNGTEFRAVIVENQPGEFIKIRITEDELSTIKYADIASIRQEQYRYHTEFTLPRGLFVEGAYAFMFGKSGGNDDLRVGMSLGATLNYRFNPHLALGAGIDVNTLYVNGNYLLVPFYARISGSMSAKRVAPYYILDLGWSTASTGDMLEADYKMQGGPMFRPELGVRVNKVRIGIGYQNQQISTTYTNTWWWGDQEVVEEERILRNIRLGVSVIF